MRSSFTAALLALALLAPVARAEDPKPVEPGPFVYGTNLALNLSQSAFSSNWAGGDRGSIVWVLSTASTAERQFSKSFNWKNSLALAYGQTTKQVPGESATGLVWDRPDKTSDQIAFESIGRWTLGGPVDPFAGVTVESQFSDQSDPRGKLTFNPVKIKESAGIARLLFKTDDSQGLTRLGFAARQTLARSFTDAAGLETASFTSNDGGIEWVTELKQPILDKKVLWVASLGVYEPLFFSKSSDLETVDAALIAAYPGRESIKDFWKAPDANLQNTFSAQITKAISVNLVTQLVYDKFDTAANIDPALAASTDTAVQDAYRAQIDKNVRKAGQFREVLALGFTYRLF